MPYSVDGDFGKVRLASFIPTQLAQSALDYTPGIGWHLCNDLYRINRETPMGTYLLFITLHGCGHLRFGGVTYELEANTAGVVPPDQPVEYHVPADGLWEFYWVHLNGPLTDSILKYLAAAKGPVLTIAGLLTEITDRFEEIISLKNTEQTFAEIRASQLIGTILHSLLLCTLEPKAGGRTSSRTGNNPVDTVIRHIEAHYTEKIIIEDLSGTLFINAAHLTRLFKARTGFSPYEYLKRYRIMKSKELLLFSELSIKEIALQTGFAQVSNFIHQFKELENKTPGQFRR